MIQFDEITGTLLLYSSKLAGWPNKKFDIKTSQSIKASSTQNKQIQIKFNGDAKLFLQTDGIAEAQIWLEKLITCRDRIRSESVVANHVDASSSNTAEIQSPVVSARRALSTEDILVDLEAIAKAPLATKVSMFIKKCEEIAKLFEAFDDIVHSYQQRTIDMDPPELLNLDQKLGQ
jgi:hypothetical protein